MPTLLTPPHTHFIEGNAAILANLKINSIRMQRIFENFITLKREREKDWDKGLGVRENERFTLCTNVLHCIECDFQTTILHFFSCCFDFKNRNIQTLRMNVGKPVKKL